MIIIMEPLAATLDVSATVCTAQCIYMNVKSKSARSKGVHLTANSTRLRQRLDEDQGMQSRLQSRPSR